MHRCKLDSVFQRVRKKNLLYQHFAHIWWHIIYKALTDYYSIPRKNDPFCKSDMRQSLSENTVIALLVNSK